MSSKDNKSPFLDNIPTSGTNNPKMGQESEFKRAKWVERNKRRAGMFIGAIKENKDRLRKLITYYQLLEDSDAPEVYLKVCRSAIKALKISCSEFLGMEVISDKSTAISFGLPSSNRIDSMNQKMKAETLRSNVRKYFEKPCNKTLLTRYNAMSVVLTLPHDVRGFKGEEHYYKKFNALQNRLYKSDIWKKWVVGGFRAIETTKGENGRHIHSHNFCLITPGHQNRNQFALDLLLEWNKLSVDENRVDEWTTERLIAIRKGPLKNYNEDDQNEIISLLDPRGSTFVGVENLYYRLKKEGPKIYVKKGDVKQFERAIMEIIKYNFKPADFKNDEGEFCPSGAVDWMVSVKHQRLFDKFGIFRMRPGKDNTHAMRFSLDPSMEEIAAEAKSQEGLKPRHPETGEDLEPNEVQYFLAKRGSFYLDVSGTGKMRVAGGSRMYFTSSMTRAECIDEMIRRRVGKDKVPNMVPNIKFT
jgi:hypothetical protein